MWDDVVTILVGVSAIVGRKQLVRANESFQRKLFPRMKPCDAATNRNSEIVFAFVGVLAVATGVLGLLT